MSYHLSNINPSIQCIFHRSWHLKCDLPAPTSPYRRKASPGALADAMNSASLSLASGLVDVRLIRASLCMPRAAATLRSALHRWHAKLPQEGGSPRRSIQPPPLCTMGA